MSPLKASLALNEPLGPVRVPRWDTESSQEDKDDHPDPEANPVEFDAAEYEDSEAAEEEEAPNSEEEAEDDDNDPNELREDDNDPGSSSEEPIEVHIPLEDYESVAAEDDPDEPLEEILSPGWDCSDDECGYRSDQSFWYSDTDD